MHYILVDHIVKICQDARLKQIKGNIWSYLTLYVLMDSVFGFNTKNLGMVHCIKWGVTGYRFMNILLFLTLKVNFAFVKSVKPDEMLRFASFHLGLHCLPMSSFRSFQYRKGYTVFHSKWLMNPVLLNEPVQNLRNLDKYLVWLDPLVGTWRVFILSHQMSAKQILQSV